MKMLAFDELKDIPFRPVQAYTAEISLDILPLQGTFPDFHVINDDVTTLA